ncbi:predicted protein [Postia placenta Mad-698-R]|uniref:Fungal-type protein kinase domain-containing protein n=1 Tax=Postia placenta MAD-698-R-SB12 TaxID=670580 RepID=A0A1X6N7F8_9APHY|nr:hypothetical protein POSPLADRAFT_1137077 [Postia placenta MAD-698-R-SB12]EED83780.1 predicted protein [Postia placenta Mad-698-R]OSX64557.1 hypothetical protein POSPLADRAFT_1137077 [Postia placenta MAD-698-R-SB12]
MDDLSVQIPVWDLIRRFVPGKKPTAEVKAKLAELKLSVNDFTAGEQKMYSELCAFVQSVTDICVEGDAPEWKLVARDTVTGADPGKRNRRIDGKKKPDISIFRERDEARVTYQPATKANEGAENMEQAQMSLKAAESWHRASLVIECKSSNSDGHPFSFRPASTCKSSKTPGTSDKECNGAEPNPQAEKDVFLPQTDEAIESRGQLSDYAMHMMRSQPRQFCFIVVVAGCYARILRWDRAGAIVSEAFEFVEDPSIMVTFLYNYMTMTQEERGFDTSVVAAPRHEIDEMIAWKVGMVEDGRLSDYHTERFKEAMETKWPIYKVTIPREDLISAAELGRKVNKAGAPKDSSQSGSNIPAEDLTLLIGRPLSMSNSPTGRSTIGYVAFDMRGKRLVFMRDSWPLDSPLRTTERTVYKDLWQKRVTNIARPISGGIVKNGDKIHRTITQKYRNTVHGKDTRARIHFRLITDEVYEPLDNCKCSYELILVLSDAIKGKANIMVKRTGPKVGQVVGILIDWDLCKYRAQLKIGSNHPAHSGTWQFSSAMLLRYPMKLRQVSDDLESFVHVLHWTILMWYKHSRSESPAALQEVVLETYDKFSDTLGYDTGGDNKFSNMLLGALPFAKLSSEPLKRLTKKLAGICKEHYNASSTKEQRAKLEDIKDNIGKEPPSQDPVAPVEIDIFVRGDDPAEHSGSQGGVESSGEEGDESSGEEGDESSGEEGDESSGGEDARALLDTSAKPKLRGHSWILKAFRSVIENMEKNRYTQITIDKVDKPQFTPATESATQQSTRSRKRPSQSSNESNRSSKRQRTTKGVRTTSSSTDPTLQTDSNESLDGCA